MTTLNEMEIKKNIYNALIDEYWKVEIDFEKENFHFFGGWKYNYVRAQIILHKPTGKYVFCEKLYFGREYCFDNEIIKNIDKRIKNLQDDIERLKKMKTIISKIKSCLNDDEYVLFINELEDSYNDYS